MLDKIERLAPQWFIALVVVLLAIFMIVKRNPLHSICDTQKAAFAQAQTNFLGRAKGLSGYSYYNTFFKRCLNSNSAGGCEPYFGGFKTVLKDLQVVDPMCRKHVAQSGRLKSAMISFLVQVTRLAWGDQGPESIYNRNSWLNSDHIAVFCRVQAKVSEFYGDAALNGLKKNVLSKLPNKQNLKKVQIKERSLFGAPCARYL